MDSVGAHLTKILAAGRSRSTFGAEHHPTSATMRRDSKSEHAAEAMCNVEPIYRCRVDCWSAIIGTPARMQ
jgi:hypothetical protein